MKRSERQILWAGWVASLAAALWLAVPAMAEQGGSGTGELSAETAISQSGGENMPWDSAGAAPILPVAAPEESYLALLTKLILGLVLVGLLIWAAVYLLRKSGVGQSLGAPGGMIRIAERAYLGPKKVICLVEIGDRILALGITEQNIAPLAEWRAGELKLSPESRSTGRFAAQFKNLLGQLKEEPDRKEGKEE